MIASKMSGQNIKTIDDPNDAVHDGTYFKSHCQPKGVSNFITHIALSL